MDGVSPKGNRFERGEFRLEDPIQRALYNHLRNLVGPGPAAFYKDACEHMAMWRIFAFQDVQWRILQMVLRSGDPEARKTAEDVINRLGARGQWYLGELLHEAGNGTTH